MTSRLAWRVVFREETVPGTQAGTYKHHAWRVWQHPLSRIRRIERGQDARLSQYCPRTLRRMTDAQRKLMHEPLVRDPSWQLCLLALSIFVLVTLSLEAFVVTDPEVTRVLQVVDLLVCIVFFADFANLLARAPDRWTYFRTWGWLDLISAIPIVDPLRWGRLARVARIIRILRAVKSLKVLGQSVRASPFETLSVMTFLIVFFSFAIAASMILGFERGLESPITTAGDALWWALLAILNARSGMVSPVSPEGILATVYLNKVGLLIFAFINGSVVAWLVNARRAIAVTDDRKGH